MTQDFYVGTQIEKNHGEEERKFNVRYKNYRDSVSDVVLRLLGFGKKKKKIPSHWKGEVIYAPFVLRA